MIWDWRLGALLTNRHQQFNLVADGAEDIPGHSNRVAISVARRNTATDDNLRVTFTGELVVYVTPEVSHVYLSMVEYGPLIRRGFSLHNDDGTSNCIADLTEWFMPADYIAAMLESFATEYAEYLQKPIDRDSENGG